MQLLNHICEEISLNGSNPLSSRQNLHCSERDDITRMDERLLDEVPVMSATVLGLEIILHEPVLDLSAACELVLSDVGATIQVLRLIEREFDCDGERPYRMSDCLASLDSADWFGAICRWTFPCDQEHAEVTALWRHCRLVAQHTQLLSEWLDCVSPEDAYMVGLLHGIGGIPTVLDWRDIAPGAMRAMEGVLPLFVHNAMRSVTEFGFSSDWGFLLIAAHEFAGAPLDCFAPSALGGKMMRISH
jgi:hypothetical protein